jgi:hypothetical protein
LSPTPERVRYVAQTLLGGVLRETEKIIDVTAAKARGEETPVSRIPVASRFYGVVQPDRIEQSRYFENINSIEKIEGQFKAAKKAGDGDAMERIQKNNPNFVFINASNKVQTAIQKLNKQAVQVIGNREEQKAIDEARIATMKELNEGIRTLERERRAPTVGEKLRDAVTR